LEQSKADLIKALEDVQCILEAINIYIDFFVGEYNDCKKKEVIIRDDIFKKLKNVEEKFHAIEKKARL
jgi:hypothetical protein